MKKIFFILSALILTNCATTTSYQKYKTLPSTPESQKILIYSPTEKPEQEYLVIGTASFNKDEETFICDYSEMTGYFVDACRYIGGDAVMITEMQEPDLTSCYRGSANIIKFVTDESYAKISRKIIKEYPPIPDSQAVKTYSKSEKPNNEFQVIGSIEFDDTGKTFICDSTDMMETFTKECRKIGGDAVQIKNIKAPSDYSTCYRGSADILKFSEKKTVSTVSESQEKTTTKHTIYVAVLETVSHGVIKQNENLYLTDVLREVARRVLPTKANYLIMTRENILAMLPPDKSIEECEGGCIVETGRNISAEYVAQARINTYGSKITIGVELYHTSTGNLISSFNAKSDDLDNLEKEIREKAPDMFSEIKVLEATEK